MKSIEGKRFGNVQRFIGGKFVEGRNENTQAWHFRQFIDTRVISHISLALSLFFCIHTTCIAYISIDPTQRGHRYVPSNKR